MKRILAVTAVSIFSCMLTPAWAGTFTFDWADINGIWSGVGVNPGSAGTSFDLGATTATYTLTGSGLNITATEFPGGSGGGNNLYIKGTNQGPTEQGIGTTADASNEHEIVLNTYV